MSQILTALRALKLQNHNGQFHSNLSEFDHVTLSASAADSSALREYAASRALEMDEGGADLSEDEEEDATVTMTELDFSALEERIARVVEIVKQEREAHAAAEQRAMQAEGELALVAPRIDALQQELDVLKIEREHIRRRLEQMVAQLDSIEL